ncbi:WD40-repeat-containing domain protein [Sphaerosporella brunnea]|uniref:WD40-repeat-containing domain protein n=1 Tax=Sphaerosporella brunnea TaxID=1250544 RepID=A0A5J5EH19_9PEZI|nr:WD40-repeat-containing domain protein [Sphaerosporella brunnea]
MPLQKLASVSAHTNRIWQCTPHPTLPLLATASGDKSSRIISLLTYNTLSTIDGGHKRSIRSVAWKPNTRGESVLASGSFDATAGIWRRYEDDSGAATGEEYNDEEDEEWRFAVVLDGHESEIKSVAWSAGGSFLPLARETRRRSFCSASYDDTIRLYREDLDDWVCCTLLEGHESTVWCITFEPLTTPNYDAKRGARLAHCKSNSPRPVLPSRCSAVHRPPVLRPPHSAPPASISAQSCHRTGRIASCGGDGKIVLYEEDKTSAPGAMEVDGDAKAEQGSKAWKIVAELKGAHGVYEINNVAWSKRYDKDKRGEDDEIIVSVGDDGNVNIWAVE